MDLMEKFDPKAFGYTAKDYRFTCKRKYIPVGMLPLNIAHARAFHRSSFVQVERGGKDILPTGIYGNGLAFRICRLMKRAPVYYQEGLPDKALRGFKRVLVTSDDGIVYTKLERKESLMKTKMRVGGDEEKMGWD
jgi:hypothetical protein